MSKSLDRARYDIAMGYAKKSYPHFQAMFNTDNKLSNMIAAYLMLDCAIRCLGTDMVQETLDADVAMKNVIADVQAEFPEQLKRLEAVTEEIPDNIIYVDFKNQAALAALASQGAKKPNE